MKPTFVELTERVLARLTAAPAGTRVIIGVTGSPGAGKTTLTERFAAELRTVLGPDAVAHVPMDGYHLADSMLERLDLRERKGAPETFDAYGYLALLQRLRLNADPVVYAPGFDRDLEQPIAGAIAVPQQARVIISEGNYLLMDGAWSASRKVFDEVWYCRPEERIRLERLLARHLQFGKSRQEAMDWIARTDQPNAVSIAATIEHADLVIMVD